MSLKLRQIHRELDEIESALQRKRSQALRAGVEDVERMLARLGVSGRSSGSAGDMRKELLSVREKARQALRMRTKSQRSQYQGVVFALKEDAPAMLNGMSAAGMMPVAGYISTFGNVDEGGDVVDQGAYAATIADLRAAQQRQGIPFAMPMLYQHDSTRPIGGWTNLSEDGAGLFGLGLIDTETTDGKNAASMLRKGYVGGISIGYQTVKSRDDAYGNRHLQEIKLFEASIVTFPMNTLATVTRVGSF